ncbi:hypothetical protein DAI22_07g234201 [Oryza sativa Japonica Group]|nr:hypothetical protein DAI22_07g234201 [Oryza sativa Japonica Group]
MWPSREPHKEPHNWPWVRNPPGPFVPPTNPTQTGDFHEPVVSMAGGGQPAGHGKRRGPPVNTKKNYETTLPHHPFFLPPLTPSSPPTTIQPIHQPLLLPFAVDPAYKYPSPHPPPPSEEPRLPPPSRLLPPTSPRS